MSILVDSSIWIDYFRDIGQADALEFLIEEDLVISNDLILAELIPPLNIHKKKDVIKLLREIKRQPMSINWDEIIQLQTLCLAKGINGVGIPDLIIVQNAIQGGLKLLSNDKHFSLLSKHLPLELFS